MGGAGSGQVRMGTAWTWGAVRLFEELDDNASHTPDVGSCHRSEHSTTSGAAECASDWNSGTEVNRRTPDLQ